MQKKEKVIKQKVDFLNPFDFGVNYKDFLESIPTDLTIESHCKNHLTNEQIEWLIEDIKHFTNKLNK